MIIYLLIKINYSNTPELFESGWLAQRFTGIWQKESECMSSWREVLIVRTVKLPASFMSFSSVLAIRRILYLNAYLLHPDKHKILSHKVCHFKLVVSYFENFKGIFMLLMIYTKYFHLNYQRMAQIEHVYCTQVHTLHTYLPYFCLAYYFFPIKADI